MHAGAKAVGLGIKSQTFVCVCVRVEDRLQRNHTKQKQGQEIIKEDQEYKLIINSDHINSFKNVDELIYRLKEFINWQYS